MTVEPTTRVQMNRHERKFVQFKLATDPAVTDWELSFDDGTTWHPGEAIPGQPDTYRWLVSGSRVSLGGAVVQLGTGSYELVVRAISNPELVVKRAVLEVD